MKRGNKIIYNIITFSLVALLSVTATNCPDGQDQVGYEQVGHIVLSKHKTAGTWYFTVLAQCKMILNCDADPCITSGMLGYIEVYGLYDYGAGDVGRLSAGGNLGGSSSGNINLCNEGDSYEYSCILTDSDANEPLFSRITFPRA